MASTIQIKNFTEIKTLHLFLLLLLGTIFTIWVTQNFIMTNEVYHNLFSERMEAQRIDELILTMKKFSIWNYVVGPIFLFLRLLFIALLVQLPLVFKSINISFSKIFRITSIAFIAIYIMSIVKLIWMLQIPSDEITEYTLSFIPLAITNFMDPQSMPKNFYGFLSNFNLFEAAWLFLLTVGLSKIDKIKKIDASIIALGVWVFILTSQFLLLTYLNKMGS